MVKKAFLMVIAACSLSLSAMGQVVAHGKLQPIHVDGNQLKDPFGNKVVLHGVMDTPSPYFNNNRWGGSATDNNVSACLNYFNKLFTAMTDSTQGAYCNLFRLHLDPCWTNNGAPNYAGWPQDARESGDGEANITDYDPSRLKKYLNNVYWKIANYAMKHGLYVIMRPPGVCPGNIYVGGSYQKYLLNVWDIVTQNDSIKKYYGQISIELANEPVGLKDANGNDNDQALRDFFQPIVDKIRANGFKGIIWVPGTGWQSNYRPYAKYPVLGDQIGYAVHDYVGWYNTSDNSYNHNTAIQSFGEAVPVVRTNPIVITEVDWSPYKEGTGHYDEHGNWVLSNYGTWATGSTSKWGLAYKAVLDYYGNISMTLSGTHTYLDVDTYLNTSPRQVVPAFKTAMEKNGLDPYEASGVACFRWYADYAKVNYPWKERYQPRQEIPENPFALQSEWFNPTILYENTASFGSRMTTLKLKKGGCAGWRFEDEEGIDISKANYLVVKLIKSAPQNVCFALYDTANYWAEPYIFNMSSKKTCQIDLREMTTKSGNKVDPSHIRLAGIKSLGGDVTVYIESVFLSMDGENPMPKDEPVTVEQITNLIDQYLQNDGSITIQDITDLIDKYLEQGN